MDPISNMLIMIKNASLMGHKSVFVPFSNFKYAVAMCLEKEGFVDAVSKKTRKEKPFLEIVLSYKEGNPKINQIERISKLSKRVYFGVKDINKVRGGSGLLVLSTPKGVISGGQARKEQVGGEVLFKLW